MSHRHLVALGLASVLLAGLAACGDDTEPAAAPSPSVSSSPVSPSASASETETKTGAAGALPTVKGDFGEPPSVDVPDSAPPDELVVKALQTGKGPAVQSGDVIVVDYLGVRWENGQTFDSSFDRGSPAGFSIGTGAVIDGWDQALVGVPVGSRALLVIPPDLAYGDTPPGPPIEAGDTLVFVVDILGAHAPGGTAKGEPAPTEDDSLPYVSISPREPDMVIPPGFDPPRRLIAIPVVVGSGPKVQAGQTVVVQYKGLLWRNGKVFDSSWSTGQPFVTTIGAGAVIPGWDKGLVGRTVGSRVMLVVPPKDGYGDDGNGQIRGTDTMVFAVDILGAY